MKKVDVVVLDASYVGYRSMTKYCQELGYQTKTGWVSTGTVFSFMKDIIILLEKYSAKTWLVVWDDRPTFRINMDNSYKADRKGGGTEEERAMRLQMRRQLKEVSIILRYTGIRQLKCCGREADDILATLSVRLDGEKVFIARDKDLYQLLGNSVTIYDFLTEKNESWFRKEYGIAPSDWVTVQALTGDSTDNVPGVKGIGTKTAVSLVRKYGSLNEILDSDIIKQEDMAIVNNAESLVRLCCDCELVEISSHYDPVRLRRIFESKHLHSLMGKLGVFQQMVLGR